MRALAVSVLVDLKDRFSRGLGGLRRKLSAFARFGQRMGLNRVASALTRVGKQATLMATLAVGAFTAATGAAWGLARGIAAAGDAAFKAGQRTGVHVETLQELAYAAELSDLPIDSLQRGIGRLADLAGKSDEMFKKLGIQLKGSDGKLRDTGDYLKDLADIFAALPDGTEKTALAVKVFGDRLGRELIPFLNEGRAGLERLGAEARDLGIVLPENLAKASVEWNDNVARLLKAFEGLKMEVLGPLIPMFNDLTNEMRAFIAANKAEVVRGLSDALKSVIGAIPNIVDGIRTAGSVFGTLLTGVGGVVDALGGLENVAVLVAAALSAKLIIAIYALGTALLTTPVGWFLGAVMAIALAAKLIYDNWDEIAAWFAALWEKIKAALSVAWDYLKEVISWHPLALIANNWSEILAWFQDLGGKIAAALSSASTALVEAGSALMQALWDGLKAKFAEMIDWVAAIPGKIGAYLSSIDPMASLRSKLPSWAGGFSDEEIAKRNAATGAIDRITTGGGASKSGTASSTAPLTTVRQETEVGGVVTIKVEGPGTVTGIQNANTKVPLKPARGASAALE